MACWGLAMTEGSARNYERHHDLIVDALHITWIEAPGRRTEVEKCLRDLHEWHNHDQEDEDEHCDPKCPAWSPGSYCTNCGVRHRKPQSSAVSDD